MKHEALIMKHEALIMNHEALIMKHEALIIHHQLAISFTLLSALLFSGSVWLFILLHLRRLGRLFGHSSSCRFVGADCGLTFRWNDCGSDRE